MLLPVMTVVISMLRGVNVGGHNKIKMDALRDLYESLGLRDAQTYVQSGNVVFRTNAKNIAPWRSGSRMRSSTSSAFDLASSFAPLPS